MLSIALMSGSGLGAYYTSFARPDYYLNGGEPPGRWFGEGAKQLGLEGVIAEAPLRNLLLGFSPDGGSKLVQNAGRKDRQSGWDLTFGAPKSVSVLWATSSEPVRRAIESVHEKAVRQVLQKLEQETALTRRGKGGQIHEKAFLVSAIFGHGTNRNLDPHLHSHALILNVAVRADGSVGTLLSKPIFQRKMELGKLYRDFLAKGLQHALGLRIRKTAHSFELSGIPEPVLKFFSSRRAEIVADVAKRGLTSAQAAKISALNTRSAKKWVSRHELFTRWRSTALQLGFGPREIAAMVRTPGHRVPPSKPTTSGPHVERPTDSRGAGPAIPPRVPPSPARPARGVRHGTPRLSQVERQDLWKEEARLRAKQSQNYGRVVFRVPTLPARLELRVVRQLLFPQAPRWSPFRTWSVPRLVVRPENVPLRPITARVPAVEPPVAWRKQAGPVVLQVRQRILFPKAPQWSPLVGRTIPVLSAKVLLRPDRQQLLRNRPTPQPKPPPEPPRPPTHIHDLNR